MYCLGATMTMTMRSLRNSLARAIRGGDFEATESGILFPSIGVLAAGEYFDRINGGKWEFAGKNLLPTEGLSHILNVALGGKAKPAGYYLALFSGATAPNATWTAANFATVASEIVSQTEGYTLATRPQWSPTDTATNQIDNLGTVATVTIATTGTLTVTGAALLSSAAAPRVR